MKTERQIFKRIRNEEDIDNLRYGDKVNMAGYGLMLHKGTSSCERYIFLGRAENPDEIIELKIERKGLYPSKRGILGINGTVDEYTLCELNREEYNSRNRLLRSVRL